MTPEVPEAFLRTAMLVGEQGVQKLAAARVAVFGVGGVGSYAVEALARAGIGALLLVDHDRVDPTNINRQLHATTATVGQPKTALMAERIRLINPDARVETAQVFCLPENAAELLPQELDYIVDAVDTVSAKIALAELAALRGVPIVSAMGAAGKLDPAAFRVADLYETSVCPLCRVMRRELRRRGVDALRVVYSPEPGRPPAFPDPAGRHVPGSISFVPATVGLLLASVVVRDLLGLFEKKGESECANWTH